MGFGTLLTHRSVGGEQRERWPSHVSGPRNVGGPPPAGGSAYDTRLGGDGATLERRRMWVDHRSTSGRDRQSSIRLPSSSQWDSTFFDGCTRGGSPGIFGWSGG